MSIVLAGIWCLSGGGAPAGATTQILLPIDRAQEFLISFTNTVVTLQKTLYSVTYPMPGFSAPALVDLGITVVSPVDGELYRVPTPRALRPGGEFKGEVLVDHDPERLCHRLAEQLPAVIPNQTNPSAVTPGPKLLSFHVGTRMNTKAEFGRDGRSVVILLYDVAANVERGDVPRTQLVVEWPVPFSPRFCERAQVVDLLKQYLELPRLKMSGPPPSLSRYRGRLDPLPDHLGDLSSPARARRPAASPLSASAVGTGNGARAVRPRATVRLTTSRFRTTSPGGVQRHRLASIHFRAGGLSFQRRGTEPWE